MGKILSAYIFPHPPVIIPEVGGGSETKASHTILAAKKAAGMIGREKPGTIIITTPHGPVFQDYITISTSDTLAGDLRRFGSRETRLEFKNNLGLVERIIRLARSADIPCGGLEDDIARQHRVSKELDHGTLVPLHFVSKEAAGFKLVHISISGLPLIEQYEFGTLIARAVEETDENVVFIASGDLSHRLSDDGPYSYSPDGKIFDELLVESVKESDVERLLALDGRFCESAGECGLRSFIMMYGALDGYRLKPEVLSYEGPFGVGYAVARIEPGERDPDRKTLQKIGEKETRKMEEIRNAESPYVKLARATLEEYVREGHTVKIRDGRVVIRPEEGLPPVITENLPPEMLKGQAGVFVSLKKCGQLRGCIGTISPATKCIAEEIIQNAISAGTRDPRFSPVEEDELPGIVYSVDVLKEPEQIEFMDELDVKKYGVIVRCGGRSGLLLPNLEGVDTPHEQVSIALKKAGIRPDERYSMERFEVVRYK